VKAAVKNIPGHRLILIDTGTSLPWNAGLAGQEALPEESIAFTAQISTAKQYDDIEIVVYAACVQQTIVVDVCYDGSRPMRANQYE
jgi:hypothetical protein